MSPAWRGSRCPRPDVNPNEAREYSQDETATDDFVEGDIVRVRAVLAQLPRATNAEETSRASFYIARNCWCVARASRFGAAQKLRSAQGFPRLLDTARGRIAALYRQRLTFKSGASTRDAARPARPYERATAVLLTSLIFGEDGLREPLPRTTRDRYRAAGLSHLLVASGTQNQLVGGRRDFAGATFRVARRRADFPRPRFRCCFIARWRAAKPRLCAPPSPVFAW